MKKVNMHEARANLTDLVSEVHYGGERVLIGRRDKPLAVIVSVEDAELLERLEHEIDIVEAKKALKHGVEHIPWEKAKITLKLKR